MKDKERFVRRVAGTGVLLGLTAGQFVDTAFYLISVFIGLNLVQNSFTDFCPAESIYERYLES